MSAFKTHPLVGLGDRHGLVQGFILYEQLVRDPRFAAEVGNVVVEFGSASHQVIIDRYVNGEAVPYEQLRKVWMDTIGWFPSVQSAYFGHFFFQVRQVNLALPPEKRIRVWLGGPPADWSKIDTREQFMKLVETRDAYAAALTQREILDRRKKALLIFGSYHFEPLPPAERAIFARWKAQDAAGAATLVRNLQKRIDQDNPGALFVAQVYVGFADKACTTKFEQAFSGWSLPVMAMNVPGTPLEQGIRACVRKQEPNLTRTMPAHWPKEMQDYARTHADDPILFQGDAILFLDPAEKLQQSPWFQDFYLDDVYRGEISRRMKIMSGQPMAADYGRTIPASMAYTQRDR